MEKIAEIKCKSLRENSDDLYFLMDKIQESVDQNLCDTLILYNAECLDYNDSFSLYGFLNKNTLKLVLKDTDESKVGRLLKDLTSLTDEDRQKMKEFHWRLIHFLDRSDSDKYYAGFELDWGPPKGEEV